MPPGTPVGSEGLGLRSCSGTSSASSPSPSRTNSRSRTRRNRRRRRRGDDDASRRAAASKLLRVANNTNSGATISGVHQDPLSDADAVDDTHSRRRSRRHRARRARGRDVSAAAGGGDVAGRRYAVGERGHESDHEPYGRRMRNSAGYDNNGGADFDDDHRASDSGTVSGDDSDTSDGDDGADGEARFNLGFSSSGVMDSNNANAWPGSARQVQTPAANLFNRHAHRRGHSINAAQSESEPDAPASADEGNAVDAPSDSDTSEQRRRVDDTISHLPTLPILPLHTITAATSNTNAGGVASMTPARGSTVAPAPPGDNANLNSSSNHAVGGGVGVAWGTPPAHGHSLQTGASSVHGHSEGEAIDPRSPRSAIEVLDHSCVHGHNHSHHAHGHPSARAQSVVDPSLPPAAAAAAEFALATSRRHRPDTPRFPASAIAAQPNTLAPSDGTATNGSAAPAPTYGALQAQRPLAGTRAAVAAAERAEAAAALEPAAYAVVTATEGGADAMPRRLLLIRAAPPPVLAPVPDAPVRSYSPAFNDRSYANAASGDSPAANAISPRDGDGSGSGAVSARSFASPRSPGDNNDNAPNSGRGANSGPMSARAAVPHTHATHANPRANVYPLASAPAYSAPSQPLMSTTAAAAVAAAETARLRQQQTIATAATVLDYTERALSRAHAIENRAAMLQSQAASSSLSPITDSAVPTGDVAMTSAEAAGVASPSAPAADVILSPFTAAAAAGAAAARLAALVREDEWATAAAEAAAVAAETEAAEAEAEDEATALAAAAAEAQELVRARAYEPFPQPWEYGDYGDDEEDGTNANANDNGVAGDFGGNGTGVGRARRSGGHAGRNANDSSQAADISAAAPSRALPVTASASQGLLGTVQSTAIVGQEEEEDGRSGRI